MLLGRFLGGIRSFIMLRCLRVLVGRSGSCLLFLEGGGVFVDWGPLGFGL